ncbi:MAG: hypothetical protein DRI65_05250 [Chloroflexota bacterium]|nr:MAG: hypothetical protein DRI65_05250 [Chloroflexota bacterium]
MKEPVKQILMIGPLPPPVGGARVLFHNTVEYMETLDGIDLKVIPLWNRNSPMALKLLAAIRILIQVLFIGRRFEVISFWSSKSGMLYFSPLMRIASSILNKPLVFRLFGIGFDKPINELTLFNRILARFFFLSGDLILLETQIAVDLMKAEFPTANIAIHKNYRKVPGIEIMPRRQCRRFIYLGKIRKNKGILEIIEAAESLNTQNIIVDIYGPFEGDLSKDIFDNCRIVKYCGIIEPDNVADILNNYHALLLPTFYEGEGHPGAILEAYASGLPVITSNWQAIVEIVDGSSGILISPGNVESLRDAMIKLINGPDFYQKLIRGALKKRQEFSLISGVERFLTYCNDL